MWKNNGGISAILENTFFLFDHPKFWGRGGHTAWSHAQAKPQKRMCVKNNCAATGGRLLLQNVVKSNNIFFLSDIHIIS